MRPTLRLPAASQQTLLRYSQQAAETGAHQRLPGTTDNSQSTSTVVLCGLKYFHIVLCVFFFFQTLSDLEPSLNYITDLAAKVTCWSLVVRPCDLINDQLDQSWKTWIIILEYFIYLLLLPALWVNV